MDAVLVVKNVAAASVAIHVLNAESVIGSVCIGYDAPHVDDVSTGA